MRVGWRLAAWVISGVVLAVSVAYERRIQRRPLARAALDCALAVALGGFGLALAATINKSMTSAFDHRYAVALVVWPLVTGVPALVAALALSAALRPPAK